MESLAFLEISAKGKPQPIYVLNGDEDFLKRQVVVALRQRIFGGEENEFSLSIHRGDRATFAVVFGELQTLPFLRPYRLVMVEAADPFVTRHRGLLEKYVGEPARQGIVVLD